MEEVGVTFASTQPVMLKPNERRKRAREELEKDDLEAIEDTKEFREAMTASEQTLKVNPNPNLNPKP